jgi:hypothetical protein
LIFRPLPLNKEINELHQRSPELHQQRAIEMAQVTQLMSLPRQGLDHAVWTHLEVRTQGFGTRIQRQRLLAPTGVTNQTSVEQIVIIIPSLRMPPLGRDVLDAEHVLAIGLPPLAA